jgi:hypothetical protein
LASDREEENVGKVFSVVDDSKEREREFLKKCSLFARKK